MWQLPGEIQSHDKSDQARFFATQFSAVIPDSLWKGGRRFQRNTLQRNGQTIYHGSDQ